MHKKVLYHLGQLKTLLEKDCNSCKGRGCMACAAQIDLYVKFAHANLPIKYWDLDFNHVNETTIGISEAKNYLKKLSEAYNEGLGVYLYGKNGNGKTLAACSIAKEVIRQGYSAKYMFLGEVVSAFSNSMYEKSKQDDIKENILGVDFLILDDLDKTYLPENSEYIKSILDILFRTRAQNCLPIIATANKSQTDLLKSDDVFGQSLLSLFGESLLPIMFHGSDNRETLKKNAIKKYLKG